MPRRLVSQLQQRLRSSAEGVLSRHPQLMRVCLAKHLLPYTQDREMKDAIVGLITSYENTISSVKELITTGYPATAISNDGLDELDEERGKLISDLQETLAKNCSLRRKDFNKLM
jgi:hypothetical protein